jgi:hypothetical protein
MLLTSILITVVAVSLAIAAWLVLRNRGDATTTAAPAAPVGTGRVPVDSLSVVRQQAPMTEYDIDDVTPAQATSVDTEFKLLEFSFEPKLMPGRVPDAETKMVVKPSGYAPFKFVGCQSTGYAIRWMGRYLTFEDSSTFKWTTQKREPSSCFKIVPGYCDSSDYIMLRSLRNNHFVRVDGATKKLVCVDSPTRNNADQFCWKITSTDPVKMPCGPQFLPDYGRVVNIPCEIKATPPCGEATPGFKSACCLRHPDDATCAGSVFREVMGRPLAEATLYIKTRHPGLTIKKCERSDPICNKLKPFPIYDANTIVLPYDKRLGIVSAPAFRFI